MKRAVLAAGKAARRCHDRISRRHLVETGFRAAAVVEVLRLMPKASHGLCAGLCTSGGCASKRVVAKSRSKIRLPRSSISGRNSAFGDCKKLKLTQVTHLRGHYAHSVPG